MINQYRLFGAYRALLALLVLFEHFLPAIAPKDWSFLESIIWGKIGVYLFFVVSGFVITDACNTFYKNRPIAFLKNRFWRIYPPYLLALFLSITIQFVLFVLQAKGIVKMESDPPFYSLLTNPIILLKNLVAPLDTGIPNMTSNYTIYVRYIWAVVVEIQFYLLMAAIIFFRIPLRIAVALSLLIYAPHYMDYNYPEQFMIVNFIIYFLLGSLMYALTLVKYKTNILLILITILVTYLAINDFVSTSNKKFDVITTMIIFAFLLVVFYILSQIDSKNTLVRKVDSILGDVSYPLYLNHYIVEIAVVGLLPRGGLSFIIGIIIAIGFSYIAHICVEPFTKKVRDRIRGYTLT